MNFDKIEKLIEMARKHGIHQIEVEEGGTRISVTATTPQGAGATALPHQPIYPAMPMHTPSPFPMGAQSAGQAHLATAPAAAHAPVEGASAKKTHKGRVVNSPFVGTFYRSSAPGSEPFCDIGKRVKKGDTLCIIEAMKLMNEIEAEFDGVVKEILVDNESPVEFDQPLFVME